MDESFRQVLQLGLLGCFEQKKGIRFAGSLLEEELNKISGMDESPDDLKLVFEASGEFFVAAGEGKMGLGSKKVLLLDRLMILSEQKKEEYLESIRRSPKIKKSKHNDVELFDYFSEYSIRLASALFAMTGQESYAANASHFAATLADHIRSSNPRKAFVAYTSAGQTSEGIFARSGYNNKSAGGEALQAYKDALKMVGYSSNPLQFAENIRFRIDYLTNQLSIKKSIFPINF